MTRSISRQPFARRVRPACMAMRILPKMHHNWNPSLSNITRVYFAAMILSTITTSCCTSPPRFAPFRLHGKPGPAHHLICILLFVYHTFSARTFYSAHSACGASRDGEREGSRHHHQHQHPVSKNDFHLHHQKNNTKSQEFFELERVKHF